MSDPAEVSAFYEGVAAGMWSDCPDEPVIEEANDTPVDALFRKGKSKGKGKNRSRQQQNTEGSRGPGLGKGPNAAAAAAAAAARTGTTSPAAAGARQGNKDMSKLFCSW